MPTGQTEDTMPEYVGIERFAEIYGCSVKWARELVRRGQAPRHVRLGKRLFFKETDIITWIESHVVNPENK